MLKITKRFSAILAAILIIVCMPLCVFAQAKGVLTDNAYLFSDYERDELQSQLDELSEKTGWLVIIYTNYDGYKNDEIWTHSNQYYADNYGKTTDGVMLNIDMSGRAVDFCTKGGAMNYFSDNRVDTILNRVQPYLSSEEYYDAADKFISYVGKYYDEGIPNAEPSHNIEMNEKEDNLLWYVVNHYLIIILLVSCGISALAVVFVTVRYKKNGKANIYDLSANSNVNLTNSTDTFLHKSVSVTTVSSSSSGSHSSGGHSSSHHSSGGGGSRGGGSRGF